MISANITKAHPSRALTTVAVLVAAVAGLGTTARAADMPDDFFSLRGPVSGGVNWDGLQVGGYVGYSNVQTDFKHATRAMVSDLLRQTTVENEDPPSEWPVLGSGSAHGMSYGGFVGYNWQLDGIVVGVDAAYNYTSGIVTSAGPSTLSRVTTVSDGAWTVSITGRSTLTMHDYATLRARVGYPMGQFLPYAFVGGAIGRFDYRTTTSATATKGGTVSGTETQSKDGAFNPGVAAGVGVDIALLPNMYLRAEYEFVGFAELAGIRPTIQTGRVGIGFRF